mgnify:CR=1 FL=1
MKYTEKLLTIDEINTVQKILSDLSWSNDIVNIDYDQFNNFDKAINLIISFLNNFSDEIDSELEFHSKFANFKIIISLIQPITDDVILKLFISCSSINDELTTKYFVKYKKNSIEIDSNALNNIVAYLLSNGFIYNYELESNFSLN